MQNGRHQVGGSPERLRGQLLKNVQGSDLAPFASAQVVIVGAGLAGLAAAHRLHETGVNDVIILDALDRVGGRVHTLVHSDYLLEMGAQWLHGADDNPLYHWLSSLNMLDDFQEASLGFQGIFCTSSGDAPLRPSLVEKVLCAVCDSKLALSKDENYLHHLSKAEGGRSLVEPTGQLKNASQVFRCHLERQMELDDELARNKQVVNAIFDWFLRYETIENCCDNMDQVSIQSYTDWTDLGEGTLLNFRDGYWSLLGWFCEHFPCRRWLHLNQQVLNVELLKSANNVTNCPPTWLDASGQRHEAPILVRHKSTHNCDSKSKIMTIACEHVIVTSSLGFLKENMQTFFTPELPPFKQDLIRSVGFGTVNKVVLQFETPFWRQSGGIKLVWQDADFEGQHSFPVWCRDLLAFDVVRRQPNLLIGWIGGCGAKLMESKTDQEIGEICLRILYKFLPETHERPTRLVACTCSRWHSNPFTRGSYSFQSMDSLGMNVDKLHEPLYNQSGGESNHPNNHLTSRRSKNCQPNSASRIPRVLFAGEATAGKLYSTTHGAIISGWREVDRLNDHLTANKQLEQPVPSGAVLRTQIRS